MRRSAAAPAPAPVPARAGLLRRLGDWAAAWQAGKVASPAFQRWAARFPLTRPLVRKDVARLHDLVSGFVYSQVLLAVVELDLLARLARGPARPEALALEAGLSPDRMRLLCQSAAAIGLFVRGRDGRFRLGRLGAAALGAPGLTDMIRHHRSFYGDLADPVALLRGEVETELSRFWAYVRASETGGMDPAVASTYSRLMETSQRLVAEDTLDAVALTGRRHLLDIGGGTGAFLEEVARRYPDLGLTLFDLPEVSEAARLRLAGCGLDARIAVTGGSFREARFPAGADAISLIRVLYDHEIETVRALLAKVFAALPPGGLLVVSEPMSGGAKPSRSGDAYFGFYTLAMTSGRPRAPEEHLALMAEAGFTDLRSHPTQRGLITSVVTGRKPQA